MSSAVPWTPTAMPFATVHPTLHEAQVQMTALNHSAPGYIKQAAYMAKSQPYSRPSAHTSRSLGHSDERYHLGMCKCYAKRYKQNAC